MVPLAALPSSVTDWIPGEHGAVLFGKDGRPVSANQFADSTTPSNSASLLGKNGPQIPNTKNLGKSLGGLLGKH